MRNMGACTSKSAMRKNVVDDDDDDVVPRPLPAPEKEEKNPVKVEEEVKGKKVNLYRVFIRLYMHALVACKLIKYETETPYAC